MKYIEWLIFLLGITQNHDLQIFQYIDCKSEKADFG